MDIEKAFELCFPGIIKNEIDREEEKFDLTQMPYMLTFKAIRNYSTYKNHPYCDDGMVPYSSDITIAQIMEPLRIESNDGLFEKMSYSRTDDL
jgi:hypothetical protein